MSSQGQGHFEVFLESNCKCLDFYPKAGGWLSSECFLVIIVINREKFVVNKKLSTDQRSVNLQFGVLCLQSQFV